MAKKSSMKALFHKVKSKDFLDKIDHDDLFNLAAALSYYTALSLAPLLILLITFVSFLGPGFREELLDQIQALVGGRAADAIGSIATSADRTPSLRGFAGFVGLGTLLFSAGAIFGQLRSSLNKIYEVDKLQAKAQEENLKESTLKIIKQKIFNMGMVLTFVFISIVSLIISSFLSLFLKGREQLIGEVLNVGISVLIFTCLFSAIYLFLPQRKIPAQVAVASGFVTAVLFTVGKFFIGLYLGQSAVASVYGAAGSMIVLLMWVYYSSLIIFLSAEIAYVLFKEKTGDQQIH